MNGERKNFKVKIYIGLILQFWNISDRTSVLSLFNLQSHLWKRKQFYTPKHANFKQNAALISPLPNHTHLLHPLGSLPGYVNELVHLEARLHDVQVAIEGGSIAPLRHYGDLGQSCPAHEQKNICMSRLPAKIKL